MSLSQRAYCGRFAPSPTGPLHFGSLVCALASFLDARAHNGTWLIRIEDIDPPRDVPGADQAILKTLARLGMTSDIPVVRQSQRYALYEEALRRLSQQGLVYGCACSRKEIAAVQTELGLPSHVYPGICRNGTHGRPARSLRIRTSNEVVGFTDRRCGSFSENLERDVGDFGIKRADGQWAYQIAVVVDDAEQGITDDFADQSSGETPATHEARIDPNDYRVPERTYNGYSVYVNNRTHYIIAGDGDTFARIARTFMLSERTLRKYNEIDPRSTADPVKGEMIYIERKQPKWCGNVRQHTVREGETLRSLSQDYGIRLKKLARLNRLRADEAIAAGQTLKLK